MADIGGHLYSTTILSNLFSQLRKNFQWPQYWSVRRRLYALWYFWNFSENDSCPFLQRCNAKTWCEIACTCSKLCFVTVFYSIVASYNFFVYDWHAQECMLVRHSYQSPSHHRSYRLKRRPNIGIAYCVSLYWRQTLYVLSMFGKFDPQNKLPLYEQISVIVCVEFLGCSAHR